MLLLLLLHLLLPLLPQVVERRPLSEACSNSTTLGKAHFGVAGHSRCLPAAAVVVAARDVVCRGWEAVQAPGDEALARTRHEVGPDADGRDRGLHR